MTSDEVLDLLEAQGVLLESARGPVANVAELVAGEPIEGSWWGHRAGHEIYAVVNELADSPDVVRMRMVRAKVTLVHRRLWPALLRLADRFPADALLVMLEEHTATGAHRTTRVPLREWVTPAVLDDAAALTADAAAAILPDVLRPKPA
jgi:hypothetical protein